MLHVERSGDALRVQVSGEAEEIAVYDALVTAFEKENPDIDVQLIPESDKDDHLAKLTTAFSNGTPPDVWLINFREYSQYVARGAVDAIGPYLDEHGLDTSDYYDQPMEAFTYDDELQCMRPPREHVRRKLLRKPSNEHVPRLDQPGSLTCCDAWSEA